MPKFNLQLSKTLILNFAYIHSKRRKLGMFIFYLWEKPSYLSKQSKFATNSPISFIFNFWSRDKKIEFWGKVHFVLGLLARDIDIQWYAQNIPLSQALNPLSLLPDCNVNEIITKNWREITRLEHN